MTPRKLGARAYSVLCVAALLCLLGQACGSEDEEGCANVTTACQPIVSPPTFDAIYTNVIRPSCATGTGNCHNASAAAGLDMRTVDSAFAGLSSRVDPSNLGCSTLVRRLESARSGFRMPPGPTPLSEAQRCAVRQWIENGALR